MREIKFRAWDNELKRMVQWDELVSDYGDIRLVFCWPEPDGHWELMQYTGLKDKNGEEIYEGDITRDRRGSIGVIQFYDVAPYSQFGTQRHDFEMYYDGSDTWWSDEIPEDFKVIGNIYENPELLKEKA